MPQPPGVTALVPVAPHHDPASPPASPRSFASPSPSPAVQAHPWNIPIFAMILSVTLLSTASSLTGGILIYQQSQRSLELSVKQSAQAELLTLQRDILTVSSDSVEAFGVVNSFFFSNRTIVSNDTAKWTEHMTALMYSMVNSSNDMYYIALEMHTYAPAAEASQHVYCSVWLDEFSDGSRALTYAAGGGHIKDMIRVDNATGKVYKRLPTFALDADGNQGETLYIWESGLDGYAEDYVEYAVDPRNGIVMDGYAPSTMIARAQSDRFRGPRLYHSPEPERFLYGYFNVDAVYVPPPPPHPWAGYRGIRISVGYLATALQQVFDRNALPADTQVLLVDRNNGRVWASSDPGFSVVPQECQLTGIRSNIAEARGCFSNVTHHFSGVVQEAYRKVAAMQDGGFSRQSCDGVDSFLAKRLVPQPGHRNRLELLWMRPTSSVDGEVREALNLLIIFVAIVLVFDSSISVLEVVYIAIPLRHVSRAIVHMGSMEAEKAEDAIASYRAAKLMIAEMRTLIIGAAATIARLKEYRAFMPEALSAVKRGQDGQDADQESAWDSGTSTASLSARSQRSTTRSVGEGASSRRAGWDEAKHVQLSLHLQPMRMVVVLRCNVIGWSEEIGSLPDQIVLRRHTELLTAIAQCAGLGGGSLDSFQGDQFVLGWNTSRSSSSGSSRAAATALNITFISKTPRQLSMGLSCAPGRTGNMGNQQVRRYSVLSVAVGWAAFLERYARLANTTRIVVDSSLHGGLLGKFSTRMLDGVYSAKHGGRIIFLAELKGELDVGTDEWMYQLAAARAQDEFAEYNAFAEAVLTSAWAAIEEGEAPMPAKNRADYEKHFFTAYAKRRFVPLQVHSYQRHDAGEELLVLPGAGIRSSPQDQGGVLSR